MGRNTRKNQSQDKVNDSEINGKQRQSAKVITKAILITVSVLLVVIVSLFVLFNFLSPTSPTNSDPSYALSSSTTYYKNGGNFYTLTSSTPHYKCTNSSHSGTNDYLTSSVSGTCYTYSGYYSHSCSKVYGTHTSLSASAYGNHVWEMSGLAAFHRGEKYADAEYTEHYAPSKSGGIGNYYWECTTCGATNPASILSTGSYSWGQCQMTKEAQYICSEGCNKIFSESVFKSNICPALQTYFCQNCPESTTADNLYTGQCQYNVTQYTCSACNKTATSTSATGCTSNVTGYKCSYCDRTFSSNSYADCSSRPYSGSAKHSISLNYTNYVYTDIDTGSTTTTTTSYSTATGYTVSFNANGGNGSMASQYFLHSHSQTLNANTFTRENYKFKGWATSSTGAVTYSNQQALNLSSGSNMTLYASWELQQFTITLDNQGATTAGSTSVTATFGAAMPNITVPAKTGYTFGGYYTSTGGSGTQYYTASGASAKTCDLTSATTLYAKWTANTYTVAYNANGGTGTTASSTHTYDTAKNLTANGFSRPGYTFSGWATSAGGAKVYDNSASVTNLTATNGATVTLYACWSSNTYNISVDLKGGSGASGTNYTVSTSSQTRTIAPPSRTGYTFSSWSISCAGGNPTISGTTLTIPAGCYGEIAMTAVWTPITYTIQYNSNDVSGATASSSHTYDVAKNLTANSFVRTGYTFKGWATSTYGAVVYNNNHSVKNLATTQGATVNLYAVWEAVTVTLTFSAQGANNFGTVMLDVTYDSALPTIIIPTRTGYLFKGYYVGSDKIFDETGHPVPAKSTFTTDTTLTASFLRWFEVVSVTGASTTYTVYDNADADIRNSILTFQPAEGYVITSFSFDNVTWYDIEKCEQTLLNTSAAVGVTYCASTGGRALAIEFRGIFTHDVKIYLRTAAGEYTDLSVK